MPMLISVPSTDGDILIEVERNLPAGPVMRGGGSADGLQKAAARFEEGWAKIRPMATQIIRQLSAAAEGTEEVKVKFGVKFSADAGVFIASVGTEGNFAVEITWKKPVTSPGE